MILLQVSYITKDQSKKRDYTAANMTLHCTVQEYVNSSWISPKDILSWIFMQYTQTVFYRF